MFKKKAIELVKNRRSFSVFQKILHKSVKNKFEKDSYLLPLTEKSFSLYSRIHTYYFLKFFEFPNIVKPHSFNEKMQWLKLFDQDDLKIKCSDKLAVKEFVNSSTSSARVARTDRIFGKAIDAEDLNPELVYKTNHDCGTVHILLNSKFDSKEVCRSLNYSVKKIYSDITGEWAYKYIESSIFSEELIPYVGASISDYKFYCIRGEPKFCHFICDRNYHPKELVLDLEGKDMGIPIYPAFTYGAPFQMPECWKKALDIVADISRPFQFVRVDVYIVEGNVYVGELTFWPQAGTYRGEGQKKIGQMIDLSGVVPREPCYQ